MHNASDDASSILAGQSLGATVLRSLKEEELTDLINRLRLFAVGRYHGRLNADDLAMQAVADVFAGHRNWNADYPPFYNLCWIVRSIASNQLRKERRLRSYDIDVETGFGQSLISQPVAPPPSETYETDETQRGLRALISRALGDDGLLHRLVALFDEREVWKPQEMATELNVGESEIYQAKRRLRRRLGKLRIKS
jgi:DNA-directed RNA polymerase specialized sigma24 family protein